MIDLEGILSVGVASGSGTDDYEELENKPQINNVELVGNKTSADLGLQPAGEYLTEESDPVFSASASAEITSQDIINWNAKSDFSGNYNDLSNKPNIPDSTSDLQNDSGFITNATSGLENYYTKTEVDGKISSVYKYKGSVATYADLPSTDLTVGDVYNVQTDGSNYAWTGSVWDKLGGDIDLSGYQTKIDSSHKLSADLIDDTSTTNKLTNATEKSAWSAKYDKPSGGIPSTDLSSAVQTSLGKADTALQSETYTGTITSVKMNGTTISSSGEADLGTVITQHQDISGKQDTIQYSTMPTADSTTVGKIVQYIGTTDSTYTNGYFYIGAEDNGTYGWEQFDVQPQRVILPEGTRGVYHIDASEYNASNKAFNFGGKPAGLYIFTSENHNSSVTCYYKYRSGLSTHNIKVNNTFNQIYIPISIPDIADGKTYTAYKMFTYADMASTGITLALISDNSSSEATPTTLQYYLTAGAQTIKGVKTFNSLPESSVVPTTANQLTNKSYVDNTILLKAYQLAGLSEYSASSTYDEGDYVYYNNLIYKCNTTISVAEAWDSTHWTQKTYMEYMSDILIGNALGGSY